MQSSPKRKRIHLICLAYNCRTKQRNPFPYTLYCIVAELSVLTPKHFTYYELTTTNHIFGSSYIYMAYNTLLAIIISKKNTCCQANLLIRMVRPLVCLQTDHQVQNHDTHLHLAVAVQNLRHPLDWQSV